ncbi:MAG: glycosyltransferase family 2 protein [Verrucomicrobiota bacterium]|jgi:glycosyltransferase involved in cell wall biosynthesis|nr:glycosyltransferase family 2 protein [Verrucomicrobiota bacterium]
MRPDHLKISACVTACDEEDKIALCLQSLQWCDEVIVVDSFSKDKTFEISKQYATHVDQHVWEGYIAQKNYIRSLAQFPWILFVDADEVVSSELRHAIEQEFERGVGETVAYRFPRMVYYLGKWIRHGEWYPDIKLRLFLKDRGHSEGQEPHDRVVVDGPIRTLSAPLYHFTYDDMADHINTLNRFSSISANEKFSRNEPFRWRDLMFRPPWRFFKSYIVKRGFLDGRQGFIIAVMSAFGVFIKYAKLLELWIQKNNTQPLPPAHE